MDMLKKRLFTIALLSFALVAFTGVNTATAQIKWGIKAGFDVVDHKINTSILNTKNRLGFQVGPTVEFGIPLLGGLETGLLYGHKEYKTEFKDAALAEGDASISDYNYLTLPLNLKKRWGLGLAGVFIYGGPYATLKLSGGDFNIKQYTEEIKSKNFGVGLNFGGGVNLFSKVDVFLQYRVDLTDRYSETKADLSNFADKKHQSWTVGLAYLF